MATARSFNSFAFGDGSIYIVENWDIDLGRRITSVFAPRCDIGTLFDAGRKATSHSIRVRVIGSSLSDLRTNIHNLVKNLDGVTASLYRNTDKYWTARLTSNPWSFDKMRPMEAIVNLTFECSDPHLYHDTVPSATTFGAYANPSTPNETKTIANAGDEYCFGVFTLTGPLKAPIVVTRMTGSSQSFSWTSDIAGATTLVVDGRLLSGQVKLSGTTNFASFAGDATTGGMIVFEPGNNDIRFQAANGNNTGNMSVQIYPRDQGVDV